MRRQTLTIFSITVLLLATLAFYLVDVLVWWDYLHNDQKVFGKYLSTFGGVSSICLLFFGFLFIQMWSKNVFYELLSLAGTLLFIPLVIVSFAYVYFRLGICVTAEDQEIGKNATPGSCAYFSAVTFTTLGYGDITPTGVARMYSVSQAFMGFLVVPILISQLVNLVRDIKSMREFKSSTTDQAQQNETEIHLTFKDVSEEEFVAFAELIQGMINHYSTSNVIEDDPLYTLTPKLYEALQRAGYVLNDEDEEIA